ncbi:hypothetical protein NL108_008223 [Boleophthalmus pectinirostris]|nr:hypothetical protein NL108_008223 [Boleophthalmus pectinirostris]
MNCFDLALMSVFMSLLSMFTVAVMCNRHLPVHLLKTHYKPNIIQYLATDSLFFIHKNHPKIRLLHSQNDPRICIESAVTEKGSVDMVGTGSDWSGPVSVLQVKNSDSSSGSNFGSGEGKKIQKSVKCLSIEAGFTDPDFW